MISVKFTKEEIKNFEEFNHYFIKEINYDENKKIIYVILQDKYVFFRKITKFEYYEEHKIYNYFYEKIKPILRERKINKLI